MGIIRVIVILLCVKTIRATGIIRVIIIIMYIELRMHNFFVAEQWRGAFKQKPMWYRQRGMVTVLLIAVQIIQKLTYCIVIRCVIMNCKHKIITIV